MNRILRRTAWLSVSAMLLCACPVPAQKDSPSKIKAAAIQVEMVQGGPPVRRATRRTPKLAQPLPAQADRRRSGASEPKLISAH